MPFAPLNDSFPVAVDGSPCRAFSSWNSGARDQKLASYRRNRGSGELRADHSAMKKHVIDCKLLKCLELLVSHGGVGGEGKASFVKCPVAMSSPAAIGRFLAACG